jgi:CHAT domain-containing protein/tetratricopeptide (TPR) repeat protein
MTVRWRKNGCYAREKPGRRKGPGHKQEATSALAGLPQRFELFGNQTTFAVVTCAVLWAPVTHAAPMAAAPCVVEPARILLDRRVLVGGDETVSLPLPGALPASLLQVAEEGVDVEFEVQDVRGVVLARADNPIARQGVQQAELPRQPAAAVLVIRGKEHAGVRGKVRVYLGAPRQARAPSPCVGFVRLMAASDALYASAATELATAARSPATTTSENFTLALKAYQRIANSLGGGAEISAERGRAELSVAAVFYYHLFDYGESAAWAERAVASFSQTGDVYLEARAQALLAAAWIEVRRYEEARALLAQLVSFHGGRAERYDEALQVNNIGLSYYNESQFNKAIPYYTIALDAFKRLGETPRHAVAIQNIALCDWGLGRWQAAAKAFSRALGMMRPEPYLDLYLLTLNNSALAHLAAGKFDDALRQHNSALSLAKRAGMTLETARSLHGIGVTYYAMGDPKLAHQLLVQAITVLGPREDDADEHKDRARLASVRALATLEQESGALEDADGHYREALILANRNNALNTVVRIKQRLALSALARNDHATALGLIEPLVNAVPGINRLTEAGSRLVRAKILRAQGRLDEATTELKTASATFVQYQSLPDEFDARIELARVHRAAGNSRLAREEIAKALEASEELRVQTANPVYRASVANQIRPALDLALQIHREEYERQAAAGNTSAATALARESLQLADASRARGLWQFLAQSETNPEDPEIAARVAERATLLRDLADRRYYLATREERSQTDSSAQVMREDIARLRASLDEVDSFLARRLGNGLQGQVEQRDFALEAKPMNLIVEYWLGPESSFAWVISGKDVSWFQLDSAAAIEATARDLQTSLAGYFESRNRKSDAAIAAQAQRLYGLIIRPLEESLAGGNTAVTIVPDGALHFVPFAMLRGSGRDPFLVQRVAIRSTPALWLNGAAPRRAEAANTKGRVLLVSDPVYQIDDARMAPTAAKAVQVAELTPRLRAGVDPSQLERLIGSVSEIAGVRAQFAGSRVDDLRGLDAVRTRVLDRDLAAYRFIHIAAHGSVDAEIPSLSSLVLGAFDRKGRVREQEIRVGDLLGKRFAADVVVLSACNTSVGRSYPQEGPIGLHYAMLARGAKAVVASLWSVADETNAELMTEMYQRMIKQGERVDVALAGAMRAQLAAHPDRDAAIWAPYNTYVIE